MVLGKYFLLFLVEPQPPDSENVLYAAIHKSGANGLPRIIVGLKALRARFLIEENKRLQKEVHSVPDKISIEHLRAFPTPQKALQWTPKHAWVKG